MINITNVTLVSDDWQREAPKVRQQIYYKKKYKKIGIQPVLILPVMMILLKKDLPLRKMQLQSWYEVQIKISET